MFTAIIKINFSNSYVQQHIIIYVISVTM